MQAAIGRRVRKATIIWTLESIMTKATPIRFIQLYMSGGAVYIFISVENLEEKSLLELKIDCTKEIEITT
jgi:hypothetical protein